MSDGSVPAGTMSILREVMEAWLKRNERKAAKGASDLTFWRDGMLSQLEAIERDGPKPEVVHELKKNFEGSEERVAAAIEQLRGLRSKIGPTKIGTQLDAVLHHDEYGKSSIRDDIERLIYACEMTDTPEHLRKQLRALSHKNAREEAGHLRRQIESFNAEVSKLQRLVG